MMREDDSKSSTDSMIFSAVIQPHRSLSQRGLAMLMMALGVLALITTLPFYLMGAWPVIGFMGLDIGLIYIAFRYNNATARAYEQVFLSRFELLFRSVTWRGHIREWRFNPLWTRLVREDHPDFGLERLAIAQGRQEVEVAACLGREERDEFAKAFQNGLSEAKK